MAIIMLWETYPDPTNRDGLEMIGVPQTFPYFPCVFKRAHNFPQCFLANVWFCQYLFSQVFPHIFHIFHRSLQTFYTHLYFPDIPLILVIFSRYSTYLSHIFQIFQVFPHITLWGSTFFFFFLHFSGGFPWTCPGRRPLVARHRGLCVPGALGGAAAACGAGAPWRSSGVESVGAGAAVWVWRWWWFFREFHGNFEGEFHAFFGEIFRFWGDFNGIFARICYFSPLQDVFFLCVWQLL